MSESGPPRPSLPPSEPKPPGARLTPRASRVDAAETLLGSVDRPARLQMIAALVLGLVLVAIPLYLWRRPRSEAATVTSDGADASSVSSASSTGPASADRFARGAPSSGAALNPTGPSAPEATAALSDARVLECHDAGTRRTAPGDCDRLPTLEKALAQAISSNASCVPASAEGGTLVYVLDVSFLRKRNPIALTLPRDGRALHSPHATQAAVTACAAGVKRALSTVALDGLTHAHGRYKIAMTASYPAPSDPRHP